MMKLNSSKTKINRTPIKCKSLTNNPLKRHVFHLFVDCVYMHLIIHTIHRRIFYTRLAASELAPTSRKLINDPPFRQVIHGKSSNRLYIASPSLSIQFSRATTPPSTISQLFSEPATPRLDQTILNSSTFS